MSESIKKRKVITDLSTLDCRSAYIRHYFIDCESCVNKEEKQMQGSRTNEEEGNGKDETRQASSSCNMLHHDNLSSLLLEISSSGRCNQHTKRTCEEKAPDEPRAASIH